MNLLRLSVIATAVAIATSAASQDFPFDRDLVLDSRAMRGSKRLPVIAISQNGSVQIDLWCKRGTGQATLAGDTMTIAIGAMKDEPCTPERAQTDEEMIATLTQVTGWSLRGEVVTLTGANPLRFRASSN